MEKRLNLGRYRWFSDGLRKGSKWMTPGARVFERVSLSTTYQFYTHSACLLARDEIIRTWWLSLRYNAWREGFSFDGKARVLVLIVLLMMVELTRFGWCNYKIVLMRALLSLFFVEIIWNYGSSKSKFSLFILQILYPRNNLFAKIIVEIVLLHILLHRPKW